MPVGIMSSFADDLHSAVSERRNSQKSRTFTFSILPTVLSKILAFPTGRSSSPARATPPESYARTTWCQIQIWIKDTSTLTRPSRMNIYGALRVESTVALRTQRRLLLRQIPVRELLHLSRLLVDATARKRLVGIVHSMARRTVVSRNIAELSVKW